MAFLDQTPVTALKGVGAAMAERLQVLGLVTVADVLFHLPLRYQDRTRILPIRGIQAGDTVQIDGEVKSVEVINRSRKALIVRLSDESGQMTLRFFHFNPSLQAAFALGKRVRCFGEVRRGPLGLEMIHPEFKSLDQIALQQQRDQALSGLPLHDTEVLEEGEDSHAVTLTPVYPATQGLTQKQLRGLVLQALEKLSEHNLPEYLPLQTLQGERLALHQAIRYLHAPPPHANLYQLTECQHPAQVRLAFEELCAHQLSLRRVRKQIKSLQSPRLDVQKAQTLRQDFVAQLPFSLTAPQARVVAEIDQDLISLQPMMRLVQGDVGCGKTVVAAMALLNAVANGWQVAMMAPTELLAEQHARTLSQWFDSLQIQSAWLAGRLKGKARDRTLSDIASGQAQVIVGTHALFQEQVQYAKLGLVIVDEQHRFGVGQRLALREKGQQQICPHQLIMTATPIPRTLAMSAYADLDTSIIDGLPPGRTPVKTVVIADARRAEVIMRMQQACLVEKRQAYWVCTLIEESETLTAQAAEQTAADLIEQVPTLRVGLVHGRLKSIEKDQIMQQFKQGELDLLVATTVIEVGVDVPNASLMIIENAERLGLAQLHQLRGRVGRGSTESTCLLMYHPPLSQIASARLGTLRQTNDGFEIAQKDLALRGPGEVLGTKQTGMMSFKIADLIKHADLLDQVREGADLFLTNSPTAVDALIRRWVGQGEQYAKV